LLPGGKRYGPQRGVEKVLTGYFTTAGLFDEYLLLRVLQETLTLP
jgi:hypothetical protein